MNHIIYSSTESTENVAKLESDSGYVQLQFCSS
jgi:hypothetical protein